MAVGRTGRWSGGDRANGRVHGEWANDGRANDEWKTGE